MSDRLSPQREAEIRERFAATRAARSSDVDALLAELAAVRAERDEAQERVATAQAEALRLAAGGAHLNVHSSAAEGVRNWLLQLAEIAKRGDLR
ncbi:hypothetical protein [Streptomyces sp. KN37]|uniref:hypothetical protein n=1 Tax=Streptomyces sp. KN37 TaxID=3090667 RepID=UPI002A762723|nr:hypothetical protein [Streptomyces sp. KN37]WPO70258.1 hypothetical protein R9806_06245 [Streptomyces sp. KN37]